MARGNDVQLGGITDLNLLADIKPGFVDALEAVTYVDRLRKVLRTLNGLRLGARESSWPATPFTDVVARWRIVHSFRWSIVDGVNGSPDRLLLSVNFDGGWEPYMRVIWDQLGSTLDLILCHTTDYPLSCRCSFETYAAWVRAHEVSADFLFIESSRTVGDAEYLRALEAAQREQPGARTAVRLHTPTSGDSARLPDEGSDAAKAMARAAFTPLSALYTLQRYFHPSAPDGECLRRASRDILFELVQLKTAALFPTGSPERSRFAEALHWFESAPQAVPAPVDRLTFNPGDIQAGLLSKPPADRGALLLLMVTDPALARQSLVRFAARVVGEGEAPQDGLWLQLALSFAGLARLGLPEARLGRFPQAFKEGMPARAGLLGDVRHNHPRQWCWPRRVTSPTNLKPGTGRIDPAAVHVLLQLRFASPTPAASAFSQADEARLLAAVQALLPVDAGLMLLGIERMRSRPDSREAFGFKDGISQPSAEQPAQPPQAWSDWVERGELLMGYRTDRDRDHPVPERPDDVLDNGSFLVVRKLRQDVGALEAQVSSEARRLRLSQDVLMGKLMGRSRNGDPLAAPGAPAGSNDFNYDGDRDGQRCPLHAHIRRANPRLAPDPALRRRMPRILCRGMSYDGSAADPADQGLVFMAYNAHLAEQFEVIQRWMAGANASGGYSGQPDPLLGVVDPASGQPRVYPFEHNGQVHAMQLGPKPFVTLQWGGYYFVPSRPALHVLAALPAAGAAPVDVASPNPPRTEDGWRAWLDDANTRDQAWSHVRAVGGVLDTGTPYGVLVGSPKAVCDVLRNQDGRYSVSGYGRRMQASIGLGFLGLDDGDDYRALAPGVNEVIESVTEAEALVKAREIAATLIDRTRAAAQAAQPAATSFTLDLEWLSMSVVRALCQLWFGLPDGTHLFGPEQLESNGSLRQPQFPQALFPVSRQVFWPHPSELIARTGEDCGRAVRARVEAWLAGHPQGGGTLTPLMLARLPADASLDLKARTIAGVVLGFPPTTYGNLLIVMAALMTRLPLGEVQQAWLAAAPVAAQQAAWLRGSLTQMLCKAPAPFAVWRVAKVDHVLAGVTIPAGRVLVVGLASAAQASGRHEIIFGGSRHDPAGEPQHACSGYGMGMGVMQGVLSALLDAGPLQSTGAPTSVVVGMA